MFKRPDRMEIFSFTFVFYVLASIIVVGLLSVLPSVIEVVIGP
jgi:hypothetical protein